MAISSQTGPVPAAFSGTGLGRRIKKLLFATRPKFFPASVLPVIAGSAWGWRESSDFDPYSMGLAMLATMLVHAGGNVINDVTDDVNGTDRKNKNWVYPYTGGSRFIQSGVLSRAAMRRWGIGLLIVALAAGTSLWSIHGMPIVWMGLAGIALGVAYSVSPLRLNTRGLGELCVAVAFGVLPVCGAAWLQGAALTPVLILYSLPVSLWVANILLVNEFPDREADALAGKRTLVVRLGNDASRGIYVGTNVAAVALVLALTIEQEISSLGYAAVLLLVPVCSAAAQLQRRGQPRMVQAAIARTLLIHSVGTILLVVGLH